MAQEAVLSSNASAIKQEDSGSAQKKGLVLESFADLGLALRLQRKCNILGSTDAAAMRYYIVQMRKNLNKTESLTAIVALNQKARGKYQAQLKAAGGDTVALCNKEAMTQMEDSLTSARLINEMLGNRPFDDVAEKNRAIVNMLKSAARLKGAAKQCTERMKEPGFSGLVSKLSTNKIILTAMGAMKGIEPGVLVKIREIEAQTAALPVWKQQCRVDIFQLQNSRMKSMIAQLRQ